MCTGEKGQKSGKATGEGAGFSEVRSVKTRMSLQEP